MKLNLNRIILFFAVIVYLAPLANARDYFQNPVNIYSENEIKIAESQILIYRDDLNSLDINGIKEVQKSDFLRLTEMKFFDKSKPHWVYFRLTNQSKEIFKYVLEGGRNSIETYYLVFEEHILEKQSGYLIPLNQRDLEQNYLSKIGLNIPGEYTVDVYVKVESKDNLPLDFNYKLVPRERWELSMLQINQFEGLFSGIMVIFIILSLVFYGRTKSKVFLTLALYSLANLIYFAHVHGVLELYFARNIGNAFPPAWFFPLLISTTYFQFAREYNETSEYFPKWDKVFNNLSIFSIILFAILSVYASLTLDYFISIRGMQVLIFAYVALGLAFLFQLYQTGTQIQKYFVYGSIFFLFSVIISLGSQFLYISNSIPIFVQIGLIIEVFIFSLGISHKAKLEYEEHDITQKSLILQLQKNDRLKESINNKLREEVSDRTLELRQRNTELSVAKDTAEKATSSKSEFLSVMSHEIRTPLNAIISLSHIMEIDNENKNMTEYIDALKFSTENLHSLINDILDYNKIEANKLKLESIEFSLIDTLRNTSEIFKFKAKSKGIDLRIEIGEHTPDRLLGDPTRLSQILNNLLGNAIKFTNEGHVTLKVFLAGVKDEKAMIHFDVIDTGIGIPNDKIETIFNEFEQASNSTTREFGGTGLGLSITKKLINLMGSDIKIDKKREEGTKFSFELPFVINKSFNIFSFGDLQLEKDLKGAKVLVVDDNDMNRLVLKRLFKIWKAEFIEASSGQEAIDHCSRERFDLILIDIEMRPINAFEARKSILESSPLNFSTPFIAMSAYQTEEFDEDVFKSGFKAFVHKPFDPDELYEKIIQHLNEEHAK